MQRRALTLLEVLLAGLVLAVVMVPSIGMMSTSSAEGAKVRARVVAVNLASAMIEEMRSRTDTARAAYGPVAVGALPAPHFQDLQDIVAAYRASGASGVANYDALVASYTCAASLGSSTLAGSPGTVPTVSAVVNWTEAGEPKQLSMDGWLGSAP